MMSKPKAPGSSGQVWGKPACCPDGIRRIGGASPTSGASTERENLRPRYCGAAGIDEQTVAEFERDLSGNLYKLWNRMSSGSYIPPSVRAVEIPKKDGGQRVLGVPTVADRVAQTVAAIYLEPKVEPVFHHDS